MVGHGDLVYFARFSPDGSRIITASKDNTARVWNARTGAALLSLPHTYFPPPQDNRITTPLPTFSPDGTRILTATNATTLKVWDAKTGAEKFALKSETPQFTAALFSADGFRMVTSELVQSSERDLPVRVWDARTGAFLLTSEFRGFTRICPGPCWRESDNFIICDIDSIYLYNIRNGTRKQVLRKQEPILRASLRPDGLCLLTYDGKQIEGWRANVEKPNSESVFHLSGPSQNVVALSYSPDGSHIFMASRDGTARMLKLANPDSNLIYAKYVEEFNLYGRTRNLTSAELSPDNALFLTCNDDRIANVWDARTGAEVRTLRGHKGGIASASFSPDGSRIVTCGGDTVAKIWNARSNRERIEMKTFKDAQPRPSPSLMYGFSADGRRVVASYDKTKDAYAWDATSGESLIAPMSTKDPFETAPAPTLLAVSPDGAYFLKYTRLSGSNIDYLALFDSKKLNPRIVLHDEFTRIWFASFSPDSALILACRTASKVSPELRDSNFLHVWNTAAGTELFSKKLGMGLTAPVFSPDGSKILVGDSEDVKTVGCHDGRRTPERQGA